MKTYILRDPKTVERQKPPAPTRPAPSDPLRREDPAVTATVEAILGRPGATASGPVLFIGLDVHKDSIAVSLAPSDSTEVRRYGVIGGTHDDVLKVVKKLQAAHPGTELRFAYEAGPTGFPLCRFLRAHGHVCLVVPPFQGGGVLLPTGPGAARCALHPRLSHPRLSAWSTAGAGKFISPETAKNLRTDENPVELEEIVSPPSAQRPGPFRVVRVFRGSDRNWG